MHSGIVSLHYLPHTQSELVQCKQCVYPVSNAFHYLIRDDYSPLLTTYANCKRNHSLPQVKSALVQCQQCLNTVSNAFII